MKNENYTTNGEDVLKVGDMVTIDGNPEFGTGKIVRFYANQGTVLIKFENQQDLKYCDYSMLVKNESR